MLPRLTALNLYRLTAPAAAFTDAATRLAARVRDEGEPGVLTYRFYVSPADGTGRAVVDYASPAAWIGHHDIAMPWPEMLALRASALLEEVTLLGEVTPAIRAWIAASGLTARVSEGFTLASGFDR